MGCDSQYDRDEVILRLEKKRKRQEDSCKRVLNALKEFIENPDMYDEEQEAIQALREFFNTMYSTERF